MPWSDITTCCSSDLVNENKFVRKLSILDSSPHYHLCFVSVMGLASSHSAREPDAKKEAHVSLQLLAIVRQHWWGQRVSCERLLCREMLYVTCQDIVALLTIVPIIVKPHQGGTVTRKGPVGAQVCSVRRGASPWQQGRESKRAGVCASSNSPPLPDPPRHHPRTLGTLPLRAPFSYAYPRQD